MKNIVLTHSLSAGGTIRQLFQKVKPDWETHVIASYDDYSHGPLLALGSSREFILRRHKFWNSLNLYDTDIIYGFDLTDEHDLMVSKMTASDKTELWIADSVQDFFYAIVTLHLLRADNVDTSGLSVRFFSGEQVKWGLGVLRLEEFETLFHSSKATSFDPKLYHDAWVAISEGTGEAIKSFIGNIDATSPMFEALSAYLLRFPEFNGGLGSIERSLLGAGTDEMKKSAYTVGNAMASGKPENDHVGDLVLFKKLVELSNVATDPWFRIEGDLRKMRSCSAQLTSSGKEAVARYEVQIL